MGGVWDAGCSRPRDCRSSFHQVPGLPPITLVVAGTYYSAALDTNGCLWVWTDQDIWISWASSAPKRVEGVPPLIKAACGEQFIVAEAEEGLWILRPNPCGHQTNNVLESRLVQVEGRAEGPLRCLAAFRNGVILIDSQGAVFSCPLGCSSGEDSRFRRMSNIPAMIQASCGLDHILYLDEKGSVWSWGCGGYGQLGRSRGSTDLEQHPHPVPSLEGISALVAGGFHSLVFPAEGGLLVFGWNSSGQLGLNHRYQKITPTACLVQPALPHSFDRSRMKSARFT